MIVECEISDCKFNVDNKCTADKIKIVEITKDFYDFSEDFSVCDTQEWKNPLYPMFY